MKGPVSRVAIALPLLSAAVEIFEQIRVGESETFVFRLFFDNSTIDSEMDIEWLSGVNRMN